MDNKQLLMIILAIILAGLIISIGCFYGLNQNKNTTNSTNTTNTTNHTNITNTTNHTNTTVEHISSDQSVESQSNSKTQYIGEDGQPISEADYKTQKVYGKSANSKQEWEAQKASLGY